MFTKAVKEKLKLRLAIEGPSGSGKSYSALLIARGLVGPQGKIAMIDTEKGSGKLYSDITDFDHADLTEPYTPERYVALINGAEKAGYDCIIIDSMSHEWVGAGGVLEIHDKMPGNSWTNWGKVNPRHEAFINAILKSPCHIIATARSKQAYTQEADNNGKQQVKKMGMAPQQRDGMEYEFTAVIKMDISHQADGDKDRTGLFPVGSWFLPSLETGENLAAWLNSGVDPETKKEPDPVKPAKTVDEWEQEADKNCATVAELGAWYTANLPEIKTMAPADVKTVNSYVAQLKDAIKPPPQMTTDVDPQIKVIICPETDEEVFHPETCIGKPCSQGCPEYADEGER
jgi:hypothetical protein